MPQGPLAHPLSSKTGIVYAVMVLTRTGAWSRLFETHDPDLAFERARHARSGDRTVEVHRTEVMVFEGDDLGS